MDAPARGGRGDGQPLAGPNHRSPDGKKVPVGHQVEDAAGLVRSGRASSATTSRSRLAAAARPRRTGGTTADRAPRGGRRRRSSPRAIGGRGRATGGRRGDRLAGVGQLGRPGRTRGSRCGRDYAGEKQGEVPETAVDPRPLTGRDHVEEAGQAHRIELREALPPVTPSGRHEHACDRAVQVDIAVEISGPAGGARCAGVEAVIDCARAGVGEVAAIGGIACSQLPTRNTCT